MTRARDLSKLIRLLGTPLARPDISRALVIYDFLLVKLLCC
jgi:hypothetical protein